jgi:hypothetical protein
MHLNQRFWISIEQYPGLVIIGYYKYLDRKLVVTSLTVISAVGVSDTRNT